MKAAHSAGKQKKHEKQIFILLIFASVLCEWATDIAVIPLVSATTFTFASLYVNTLNVV